MLSDLLIDSRFQSQHTTTQRGCWKATSAQIHCGLPAGLLGFASAGVRQEICHPVPAHLARFWDSDTWCIHTADWWRNHWQRTGLVDVKSAESLEDGWKLWLSWAQACDGSAWYVQTLERDAGEYLGYIRLIAQRRPNAKPLPYDLRTGKSV